ncbi:pilus assembly protein TadG-related protein, partial [Sphingomonas sp. ASV193]|uniref:pilus assembly protein TadG-related protein n=1 Tax=Sphingomonas sp. ASV193 TaxID=3144405 RepID=UPI0032E8D517
MIRFLRRLFNDPRGNVLVIAAACLPLIVGAAGLATDTIQWTMWKRQLQRAADSAAIAGVYDRIANAGATTNVSNAVNRDLTLNNHVWMALKSGYPTFSYPANSGVSANQVSVTLAIQQPLTFSSIFLTSAPTITASATAAGVGLGDPCVLALSTTDKNAVNFSGNATINMPECPVFSDSANANSAVAQGSSNVTAKSIGGVGGIQQSNNFHVTAYYPYSTAIQDPYAGVDVDPSDMKCATGSAATLDD